eukprot:CAMPEP_0173381960 /NCGR_PEP_ID=MMETSP1356-20130122/4394_1 /TAXON_ID=77927 ORGANISM="Hemiselmis virescens, Strain PCC157" /NCGR_SAMPLE_ID=MMETSP1356 /ASSEMBLY_ACC=CAM_ASM_000847 /LENGTH=57 /DNA_ID=CAMNT_0014336033 /DNA_START=483 /DNA_END=652 /DNA_ORIENTATION=+
MLELALGNDTQLATLVLTIAFSLASHIPAQRKLSTICPPGVTSITLIRAPVEVNQLP